MRWGSEEDALRLIDEIGREPSWGVCLGMEP